MWFGDKISIQPHILIFLGSERPFDLGDYLERTCDNLICCNPRHYNSGLLKKLQKGRYHKNKPTSGNQFLFKKEIRLIRKMWKPNGSYTQKYVAALHGTSGGHISSICNHRVHNYE